MNKEEQKRLLTEIMEADEKDGLYKTNNMAQQTAVEWLIKRLVIEEDGKYHVELPYGNIDVTPIIEQAKQMEREQRIKDYNAGYIDAQCNHINDAENYVNEQEYLNK